MGLFAKNRHDEAAEKHRNEAEQHALKAQEHQNKSLNKRSSIFARRTNAAPSVTTAATYRSPSPSPVSPIGRSTGGGLFSKNSQVARTGSDIEAAPGTALADARIQLQRAHEAENQAEAALRAARSEARSAHELVKRLQREAVEDLKRAQNKGAVADTLARDAKSLRNKF